MLGRLLSARIKTAEQALQAGRLDEAFRMASAPDLAAEARIRKLLDKLGQALFQRAERHYQASRHVEALQDLARAAQACGDQQRIRDMIAIVQAAAEEDAVRQRDRRHRVSAAAERIAAGSLRAARAILGRASQNDPAAARLREQLEDREARAAAAVHDVRQHLAAGRWPAAAQRLRAARDLSPGSEQTAACEKELVEAVLDQACQALESGHVARGLEQLRLLGGIGDGLPRRDDAQLIQRHFEAAGSAFGQARYEQVRRSLLPLRQLLPGAAWLDSLCDQLKDLDELITQVHAGPLGLLFANPQVPDGPAAPENRRRPAPPMPAEADTLDPGSPAEGGRLPSRLLLWVDGAGSYLLLRGDNASIGRAAARHPADIPLISDLSEHHADLRRVDGDYFLNACSEVNVGGRNVRQVLLHDGDKIILGRKARFVFQLPSRKSATAALDLVGSARMPNDVRRVILFDRLLTIGPSAPAHIAVPAASEALVLFERGGRLWVRPQADGVETAAVELVAGQRVELGGVSLVIEPWSRKQDGIHVQTW